MVATSYSLPPAPKYNHTPIKVATKTAHDSLLEAQHLPGDCSLLEGDSSKLDRTPTTLPGGLEEAQLTWCAVEEPLQSVGLTLVGELGNIHNHHRTHRATMWAKALGKVKADCSARPSVPWPELLNSKLP